MMLSRAAVRPAINAVARQQVVQQRNMATLREIELRLKSVRNIEKITKSMKMIAATKLTKAQRAVNSAKAYGAANAEVFKNSEAALPEDGKKLYVVISSDKGLCGGIHSSVSKATRAAVKEDQAKNADADITVMVVGDKSKAQLSRALPEKLALTFNGVGKDVPTFGDACAIADLILTSGVEFDSVHLVYNKVVSALAFESAIQSVFGEEALKNAPNFKTYEMEDDATKDLAEFALANAVYAVLVEGHAAEINSRRNAMDNASKNAGDMIGALTMKYNRGRQAAITNELVDIITGASAL
ncbi:atp3 gamma subunit of the F1 sector of mitochondrial F1F0 ATP synthase [Tulasnella sp. 424]|nr:atp3 gamma subunit of the F1 sector of mitochondrial F1F0 ATP synthase [Tulasnella sp. 424]KAG8963682.1 atp3 gamma subunit of the F1 sector of mitochondrial F1F0 ATP synthase [Tulasnella sp. 425]